MSMQKSTERHAHQFRKNRATNRRPFLFVRSGLPNVYLVGIKYNLCDCGTRQGIYPRVEDLLATLTKAVAEKQSRLTPLEIKYLRKSMAKDHKKFAALIGVSVTQVSRWENGKSAPSLSTERLIRHFAGASRALEQAWTEFKSGESYVLCFDGEQWKRAKIPLDSILRKCYKGNTLNPIQQVLNPRRVLVVVPDSKPRLQRA